MIEIINQDIEKIHIDLSKLKDKSILITGASGLIGVYLVAYIKSKQKEFNIKIYTWTKNEIDPMFKSLFEDCEQIIGDITTKPWNNIPMFDFIIHAGGYGQPMKFLSDKIKTLEINSISTIWLFEHLNSSGTFLFISSSEIYDGIEEYSIPEEEPGRTTTDHPRACYIEGKRCGETICHIFKEHGCNVKIVRLSLTYGPGTKKNDSRVVNSLIDKAIHNDDIKLLDRGESIRTFCYITDSIEMILNVLFFSKDTTYNIGGIDAYSILELARIIGKICEKKVITSRKAKLIGSPSIVNICIDKYVEEFNKYDFIELQEGLKNTIKWHKNL